MSDDPMFERLNKTIERKLFDDELAAMGRQFKSLKRRIRESNLITTELDPMIESMDIGIKDIKKVLQSKELL